MEIDDLSHLIPPGPRPVLLSDAFRRFASVHSINIDETEMGVNAGAGGDPDGDRDTARCRPWRARREKVRCRRQR